MSADERDVRAARMLLASLPDAPDSAVQAIAGHIAKLRDRAVDRVCEVHEQADASHAAGYAEAVADIRQMLEDLQTIDDIQCSMAGSMGSDDSAKYHETRMYAFGRAVEKLNAGDHVGAAKRAKEREDDA